MTATLPAIPEGLLKAGRVDSAVATGFALSALQAEAGEGARLSSLTVELAETPPADAPLAVEARTDKRTRAIAFVSLRVSHGEAVVLTASAVFLLGA